MKPFFSILIPTRNRPSLAKFAIESVLRQSFSDFEIIVVDNSDEKSDSLIDDFSDDRVQYFRTGNLNMPDNWEKAFDLANGEYMTVLSDRLYYSSQNSLTIIHDAILKTNTDVCSWKTFDCDLDSTATYTLEKLSARYELISSTSLLASFPNGNFKALKKYFPRGLNSAISRKLLNSIKNEYNRICPPLSPDYMMAFLQMFKVDHIMHIDRILTFSGGLKQSNGGRAKGSIQYVRKLISNWGIKKDESVEFVPLKFPSLSNTLYNDYFRYRKIVGESYTFNEINIAEYLSNIYLDLININPDPKNLKEFTEWEKLYSESPERIRNSVLKQLKLNRHFQKKRPKFSSRLYSYTKHYLGLKRSEGLNHSQHKEVVTFVPNNFNNTEKFYQLVEKFI